MPEDLPSTKYGYSIHFWDLRARKNVQTIEFRANYQMALAIRPTHAPATAAWLSIQQTCKVQFSPGGRKRRIFDATKKITIDPVPADADDLPDLLKGYGAVPLLVTDIDLSLDDKYLYIAC